MSARQAGIGLVRRPARAIPTGIAGVILLVFGGLGLWLLGTYVVEGQWPVAAANQVDALAWTTLESIAAQAAAGTLAVLGLALVLLAAWPGRVSRLLVLGDDLPGAPFDLVTDVGCLHGLSDGGRRAFGTWLAEHTTGEAHLLVSAALPRRGIGPRGIDEATLGSLLGPTWSVVAVTSPDGVGRGPLAGAQFCWYHYRRD